MGRDFCVYDFERSAIPPLTGSSEFRSDRTSLTLFVDSALVRLRAWQKKKMKDGFSRGEKRWRVRGPPDDDDDPRIYRLCV